MIEVDGTTVKFKDGVSADYEQDQSLEFTLRATDQGGLSVDKSFSLNVLDDTSDNNTAPYFTISPGLQQHYTPFPEHQAGILRIISAEDAENEALKLAVLLVTLETVLL